MSKKDDEMVKQLKHLQRDLLRANYEKDKLLQMRVAELGVSQEQIEEQGICKGDVSHCPLSFKVSVRAVSSFPAVSAPASAGTASCMVSGCSDRLVVLTNRTASSI